MTKTIDWTQPVLLRNGYKARVLATDLVSKDERTVALAYRLPNGPSEHLYNVHANGRHLVGVGSESGFDVIGNAPVVTSQFGLVYGDRSFGGFDRAVKTVEDVRKRIADKLENNPLHYMGRVAAILENVYEDGVYVRTVSHKVEG